VSRTCVVVLLIALGPAIAAAQSWRAVRVTPVGAVVVPVAIDGEGPFAFLLDTGSSRSAISATLARRLGARQVGETTVLTPSGRTVRALTPLTHISLDGSPPNASLAMILPDEDLARGIRADGIIGADVLKRFVLTIDYERLRISWQPARMDSGVSLPLTTEDGRLVVSVPRPACAFVSEGCLPLRFIPDTGADAIVLFRRAGHPLQFVTPLADGAVRSLAGVRAARRVLIEASGLQAVGLYGQVASVVDLPPEDGLLVDGLLPLHLFARVTIDGPRKKLTLVPR
jgi:aspartyl protease